MLRRGKADFANGCPAGLPHSGEADATAQLWPGNRLLLRPFLAALLGHFAVKDSLCGTKALCRAHYGKIAAHRGYFGDFDPFGDFDLLFGAAKLNLKIADVPIRYRERSYGTTNIQRWHHGWLLLRMMLFAARKLKFV